MASEKKPSIYDDRSTIGSSDELDEYGVWVKSEPRDLSAAEAEIPDSSFPDIGELPDFDMDLTLTNNGEGDDIFRDENIPGDPPAGDNSPNEDSFGIDELEFPDLDFSTDDLGTYALSEDEEEEPAFDAEDPPVPEESAPFGTEDTNPPPEDFTETSMEDLFGTAPEASLEASSLEAASEDTSGEKEENSKESGDVSVVFEDTGPEEPVSARETAPAADLSTRLLMKIADELSSIRNELSNLKREFRVLRRGEGSAAEPAEEGGHGFFDGEEDDEKISLTGDELDTILNTDFAEEPPRDASPEDLNVPEKGEDLPAEAPSFLEELPPEEELFSEEPAPAEGEIETPVPEEVPASSPDETDDFIFDEDAISLDDISIDLDLNLDSSSLEALNEADKILQGDNKPADTEDFESLPEKNEERAESLLEPEIENPELDPAETDELRMLVEKGLEPMTSPPEDTSYLEEDPVMADLLTETSPDLSGMAIEEPDLSVDISENPPEEPDLEHISLDELSMDELTEDIAVHLDMEELEQESPLSPENEEIVMDIPLEEEKTEEADFSPVIPEGFGGETKDISVSFDEEDLGEKTLDETLEETLLEETLEDTGTEPPEGDGPGMEESLPGDGDTKEEDLKGGNQGDETPSSALPSQLRQELKTVLSYMDQLLESLPEEKIEEFAKSEYFDTYKKLFKELGLA
jgi:hypothetical protein